MFASRDEWNFVESDECEAGIRLLRGLSRELGKGEFDHWKEKERAILAMMGVLERRRRKIRKNSRNKLLTFKTRVICDLGSTEECEEYSPVVGLDSAVSRNAESKNINFDASLEFEISSGRNEMGSWQNPIPSINGVPYDHFERKIFEKYVDYWQKSKLSVPFLSWQEGEGLERKSSSIINFEIFEEKFEAGCKSIQEAVCRIRKFEQDFQAIPKEIIFPLIEKGILMNNSKNELSNASGKAVDKLYSSFKSASGLYGVFKAPQSLFLNTLIIEHENRMHELLKNVKETTLVSSEVTDQKRQCNCDFYKMRQRFIQNYNLFDLTGTGAGPSLNSGSKLNSGRAGDEGESNLRLWMGAYSLPRNDKRKGGGEDGWFVSEKFQSMGVADGVGEWEDISGKSARMFSNNIMQNSLDYIKNNRTPYLGIPSVLAKNSLKEGLNSCEKSGVHGASTALVGCFDHFKGVIGFANMGDSGALVLRRLQFDTGKLEIVRRVKEMQHDFNCPYQFASLPHEREWPELLEKGFNDIVTLAKLEKQTKETHGAKSNESLQLACDDPELSQLLEVPLKEGDLVIIATDGLFDNLFDFEITSISGLTFSPIESKLFFNSLDFATTPMTVAKSIALSAYHKSLDPFSKTPFANQARRFYSGSKNSLIRSQSFSGGKEDDISVLVAWVVHKDDFEVLTTGSSHFCDISKKL
ncbi:PP2C like protein phosphatase [Cryptosporidium felis]|nr:PP2C like protein phosphatase [Cryptosporidium felis]